MIFYRVFMVFFEFEINLYIRIKNMLCYILRNIKSGMYLKNIIEVLCYNYL